MIPDVNILPTVGWDRWAGDVPSVVASDRAVPETAAPTGDCRVVLDLLLPRAGNRNALGQMRVGVSGLRYS